VIVYPTKRDLENAVVFSIKNRLAKERIISFYKIYIQISREKNGESVFTKEFLFNSSISIKPLQTQFFAVKFVKPLKNEKYLATIYIIYKDRSRKDIKIGF